MRPPRASRASSAAIRLDARRYGLADLEIRNPLLADQVIDGLRRYARKSRRSSSAPYKMGGYSVLSVMASLLQVKIPHVFPHSRAGDHQDGRNPGLRRDIAGKVLRSKKTALEGGQVLLCNGLRLAATIFWATAITWRQLNNFSGLPVDLAFFPHGRRQCQGRAGKAMHGTYLLGNGAMLLGFQPLEEVDVVLLGGVDVAVAQHPRHLMDARAGC